MKARRSNLWTFIIYPEDSCPSDYISIIGSWVVPVLLSPVHDADKNADLTEKKKHQHVMIYFGSGANKSIEQVKNYSDQLNGTQPFIVESSNSMIRYFIHKDNPEKAQYKIEDLKAFAGFEYMSAFENYTTQTQLYKFIEKFIRDNSMFNYATLIQSLEENNYQYEAMFCRQHTLYFRTYLDGMYQRIHKKRNNVSKNET